MSTSPLTYELHRSVQPGQDLLTERVVDRNSQEVRLRDEVRFGAGVTSIQDVDDVVLLHQILETEDQIGSVLKGKHHRHTQVLNCATTPHLNLTLNLVDPRLCDTET